MKPKTIILLSAFLVLCVAFIVVRRSGLFKPSQPGEKPGAQRDVLAQKVGEPKKLTIASADGTTLAFEKSGSDWRIVQPVSAKAESWKVSSLADSFKDLKGEPAEKVADDVTGLNKPAWVLTVVDDKDATHVLEIGNARPLDRNKTYVRAKGGKEAFVVSRDYATDLRRPLSEYRSKSVIDVKTDDVVAVKVAGKEKFELSRAKSGDWAIGYEDNSGKGDKDKVKDLLDKFTGLSVEKFVSDKPASLAAYGLEPGKERLVFTVQLKGEEPPATTQPATAAATQPAPKPGKTVVLAIGTVAEEYAYAKLADQPAVFQVKSSLLSDLQPKPLDIRDRKVLAFEPEDVERIEVKLGDQAVELKKADLQWQMVKPAAGPANGEAARGLLTALSELKADDFASGVKLATFGLAKPSGSIVIYPKGKSEALTVLVGDKSGSGELTFVKADAGAGVGGLPTPKLRPAAYYDTLLAERPVDARVEKIAIQRGPTTIELADDNGLWKQAKPVDAAVEQDVVNRVMTSLERLRADQMVAVGSVPAEYASADQKITVTVGLRDLPKPPPSTQPATAPAAAPATAPATAPAATPAPEPATKPAATAPAPAPATKPVEAPKPAPASATKPVEAPKPAPQTQPAARSYTVHVVKVGEKAYAWVEGKQPVLVGEFPVSLYNDLAGEFRPRKALTLNADDIDNIKIIRDGKTLEFRKDKDAWVFATDTFIKVDAEKVKNFAKDAADVMVEKYVYNPPALQQVVRVAVELKVKGQVHRISVLEQAGSDKDTRFGTTSASKELVLFSNVTADKLAKSLDDFRKSAEAKTDGAGPGMPPHGMPGMPPGMQGMP